MDHDAHVTDYHLHRLFGDDPDLVEVAFDAEYYSAIAEFLIP